MKRKIAILVLLIVALLAAGGWYLTRRPAPVEMAGYVPESALGYIEVNDWPRLVREISSTEAWRKTAPAYGIDEKIGMLGQAGWLSGLRLDNEAAILARSQLAVVLTGLEVRGDEVKPRLALLIETHAGSSAIEKIAGRRLPAFARRVFGDAVSERSDYAGVEIKTWRPRSESSGADRSLHSAIIEGELILANHEDAMRACIDARLDRMPDMASNFHLRNSRPAVDRGGVIFGFLTGDGVNRLLRFGAFMISNAALRETGLIEILQDVLSDLAARSSVGVAWGSGIEDGRMVDRYALLIKPDLVERVKPEIRAVRTESKILAMIPDSVTELTIVRIENPNQAIDQVEKAISARIGVGQSFLLHQFLLGARQSLLGIKPDDPAYQAIGDEIASFSLEGQTRERLWMVAVRDRAALRRIAGSYLGEPKATLKTERIGSYEVLDSRDEARGSAAIVDEFIILGKRNQIEQLLIELGRARRLIRDPRYLAAGPVASPAIVTSYDSVADETAGMLAAISKWVGGRQLTTPPAGLFDQLPLSAGTTSLRDQGLFIETRSPFGTIPFFLTLIDGAANDE